MHELWYLHSAHYLMLIDISMKFSEDSLNGFQVIKWTRFCYRAQGNNSKSINARIMLLMLSAHRLMLIDIYMKFCEDSLNSFQVREWTWVWQRDRDRQTDAQGKNNMSPNLKGGRDIIQ